MGRCLGFVFDASVRNECGASASEADTWCNPDGGWKPNPPIWAIRGVYINPPKPALRGVLFGCLLFFAVSTFVRFLNRISPVVLGAISGDSSRMFLPCVS